MERAVLLAGDGDIGPAHLPQDKRAGGGPSFSTAPPGRTDTNGEPAGARARVPPLHVSARLTEAHARDPEAARLLAVLDACDWNQTRAALELGVSRRTLVSRLSAYGLTRKRTR
jgi:two-component system, NtrC family, response regulator AtoC